MAEPAQQSGLMQAFWEGFAKPSALAFKVFCLALAATCAFSLWFFTETTLAGPLGQYLPRSGRDAEAFATHEALRTGHVTPERPRILLLGTSTVAQAVGPGKVLQDQLAAATGMAWEVVNLTTPLQAPTDQFALLERALESQTAESPPVVVVLGFGFQRLRWTAPRTLEMAAQPRLGLRSAWADAEIAALGGTAPSQSGFYLRDNQSFVLINGAEALLRLAVQSPARRQIDSYALGKSPGPNPDVRKLLAEDFRAGVAKTDLLLAQIGRLADRLAGIPGTRLVLIEDPLSPGLIADQDLAGLQAAFRRDVAAFADGRAIGYLPVSSQSALAAEDFFDDLHVLKGAPQQRFQQALAQGLIDIKAVGQGGMQNGG